MTFALCSEGSAVVRNHVEGFSLGWGSLLALALSFLDQSSSSSSVAQNRQLVLVAEGVGAGHHQVLVFHHVLGTAARCGRNLVRLVEVWVVNLVLVLFLEQHRLESMPPEDLASQVGASRLCRHCSGLHHSLQDDHDLKIRCFEVLLADAK